MPSQSGQCDDGRASLVAPCQYRTCPAFLQAKVMPSVGQSGGKQRRFPACPYSLPMMIVNLQFRLRRTCQKLNERRKNTRPCEHVFAWRLPEADWNRENTMAVSGRWQMPQPVEEAISNLPASHFYRQ